MSTNKLPNQIYQLSTGQITQPSQQKEYLEAIELKEQVKLYHQDEQENHSNILKIGDRKLQKFNMG